MAIDLNADLGELTGSDGVRADAALIEIVSSVNVATGGHAGDRQSMTRVCRAAAAARVTVGAHVSYPDRAGFGRVSLDIPAAVLRRSLTAQLTELSIVAESVGAPVRYVKPHGALYHDAARDPGLADLLLDVAAGAGIGVLTLPGRTLQVRARAAGVAAFAEGFADRAYRSDGTLQPRDQPGAVLHDPSLVRDRVVALARGESIDAVDGRVALTVDSICLHGDTPGAIALARAIADGLDEARIAVRPFLATA
ncbi:MAG: 5-oxoprolinase subunit PxpA [Candidatus Nanopelagicales bacterium]